MWNSLASPGPLTLAQTLAFQARSPARCAGDGRDPVGDVARRPQPRDRRHAAPLRHLPVRLPAAEVGGFGQPGALSGAPGWRGELDVELRRVGHVDQRRSAWRTSGRSAGAMLRPEGLHRIASSAARVRSCWIERPARPRRKSSVDQAEPQPFSPAQAIIAPLSVQSSSGGATSRGRRAPPVRRAAPRRSTIGGDAAGDDEGRACPAPARARWRQRSASTSATVRLERGAEIGDVAAHRSRRSVSTVRRTAVLRPEKEKSQPGCPSIGRGRAKRCGSPLARPRARPPARRDSRRPSSFGGLVERLADGVVDRRAEPAIVGRRLAPRAAGNARRRPAAADRERRRRRSAARSAHGLRDD